MKITNSFQSMSRSLNQSSDLPEHVTFSSFKSNPRASLLWINWQPFRILCENVDLAILSLLTIQITDFSVLFAALNDDDTFNEALEGLNDDVLHENV